MRSEWAAAGLSVLGGVLYFLGFAGFEIWPLSLVSLAPLLLALRGRSGWRAFRLGWLAGLVAMAGGFYWIVWMLRTFSGFPTALCIAFSSLLWGAQGILFALFAWLVARADKHRVHRFVSVPAALAAVELGFPLLFPWYTSNSLHNVPVLIQHADLGGPILISALMALAWAGLELALVRPRLAGTPAPGAPRDDGRGPRSRLRPLALPALAWLLAVPYGLYRIHEVDVENRTAPSLLVGVVQENLGLLEKRNEPEMALARHLATTRRLEAQGVDLVVWSESAVAFVVPEGVRNLADTLPDWDLHVPVLFGALSVRDHRLYNTAFMADGRGRILGTYDKTYLLAFGEYLPGGETFPSLYRISRNSGHFSAGNRFASMPLPGPPGRHDTVAPFICYEDILPRFVRDFHRETDASLFAVILNDAWFGDTAEPWIHMALSQFRSIEHRRDFVRAANSGVSGFIDAAGRVIAHTGTYRVESQVARVHLRTRHTPYFYVGDWAGWLGLLTALWMAAPRRKRASAEPATKAATTG